jgi:uncharacterized protein (TIGR03435 family)
MMLMAFQVPKFDVASIHLCDANPGGNAQGGRGGPGGGAPAATSPDRIQLNCVGTIGLIRNAYITFADGHFQGANAPAVVVEGLPKWADSARWMINAMAEGAPGQEAMRGPMLQALMEERFRLKIRRETREVPVYALTVAKGGVKMKPMEKGGCIETPVTFPRTPRPAPDGDKPPCGWVVFRPNGPNTTLTMKGSTLDEIASALEIAVDRPVVNRTGLEGRFMVNVEFKTDDSMAALIRARPDAGDSADKVPGASIFTAVQELGLKLESSKGPRNFLVVERIEKPSEN